MTRKRILGLDLGTNSIGWALVEIDRENKVVRIIGLGSRILPMDAGEIKKYKEGGKIESTAAQRTEKRGARRLNERFLLRRDRLHLVLNLLKALPEHYAIEIDFERNGKKCGQFKENKEPKIAYEPIVDSSKCEFHYEDAFNEMIEDLQKVNPNIKNEKSCRVPKDWTLYYLRQKALKEKITLEELAWVLLSYNQKRGYEKLEVEGEENLFYEKLKNFGISEINVNNAGIEQKNVQIEKLNINVSKVESLPSNDGYRIFLSNGYDYKEYTSQQLTFFDKQNVESKEVEVLHFVDESMNIIKDKSLYKISDIYTLIVDKIEYEKKGKKHYYTIVFKNGWRKENSKNKPTKQFDKLIDQEIVVVSTTLFDRKGNIVKPSFSKNTLVLKPNTDLIPRKIENLDLKTNWTLLKKKTEKEAIQFNIANGYIDENTGSARNYISPKIYDVLKQDAITGNRTKIAGGMFQVIERKFYREELKQIIETQKHFHKALEDKKVFEDCVKLLYPNNEQHAKNLLNNKQAIQHLLIEDIILYQRELKSKKSEIADCKYEVRHWECIEKGLIDKETGEVYDDFIPHYHKAVAISHPLFQEYRIWDKIHNLKLIEVEKIIEGKKYTNYNATEDYLKTEKDYHKLFDFFNNQKTVNQKQFLKFCSSNLGVPKVGFVWNFPEDEELKGNETRVSFAFRFKRCGFTDHKSFLTQDKEIDLWHYLYSVNYKERNKNDKSSIRKFFTNWFNGYSIDKDVFERLIDDFSNYPKFENRYGAYSEKALKKLLPFMRLSGNRFEDKFEISDVLQEHLKAIDYQKENVFRYLKLDKDTQKRRTKKERIDVEILKQNIHKALWQDSINKRIQEIIYRVSKVDFSQEEIDYSHVVNINVKSEKGELAFPKGLFNAFKDFKYIEDFKGLDITKASYLLYGRHSELSKAKYWKSPKQIRDELPKELKQHSLNNPIAEKVLREMMQVVADIWEIYGDSKEKYFSKIHIEVGRDLKKSAKEKETDNKKQKGNRIQNQRLRNILKEFLSDTPYHAIANNTDHFERLKIVEDSTFQQAKFEKNFYDIKSEEDGKSLKEKHVTNKDIEDILEEPKISKSQFEKYKLWIEQGYQSPYTGKFIKLSDLFDGNKYNIDHIFPRASVTNDSLNNKVVCETEINKRKGSLTGREFILEKGGESYNINNGRDKSETLTVLKDIEYVELVKKNFFKNKQYILLSKEIPNGFTSSQLNNARYIARKAMELLSHIVREPNEVEFRSKNVLPVTGKITDELKRAWQLNEVWTELMSPRFKRLNELTKSNSFGSEQENKQGHIYFDCKLNEKLREQNPDYNIKRLDHRHHALDALVIALCTKEHVNYINNINAGINPKKEDKINQIQIQRRSLKQAIKYSVPDKEDPKDKKWNYMSPCAFHNKDLKGYGKETVIELDFEFNKQKGLYKDIILSTLENTIVTFKQNNRVINKTVNKYTKYSEGKKAIVKQEPVKINDESFNKYNWAIRKPLHKETVSGIYNIDTPKGKIATSVRTGLNEIKNEKHLAKITDQRIREVILPNHLQNYLNDKGMPQYDLAFSPDGIEMLNKNIIALNNGVKHQPIYKVKMFEIGSKFTISEDKYSSKDKKYVEAAKGTNLFFAIYWDKEKQKRNYETIPLNEVIQHQKDVAHLLADKRTFIQPKAELGEFLFTLSPNDLVYVPNEEEIENPNSVDFNHLSKEQVNRIYKMVSCTGGEGHFIPMKVASEIKKNENGTNSKSERIQDIHLKEIDDKGKAKMIKSVCWKLQVDRLGNITKVIK